MEFDRFGRALGRKLLFKDHGWSLELMATPVNIVRYFEFDFVRGCLPDQPGRCLDVASPRMFGLWAASTFPNSSIRMANPDPPDVDATKMLARAIELKNLSVEVAAVDALRGTGPYDCIWSISVIEHIAGAYDDSDAMRWLWNEVRPGGRLIVTLPVQREHFDEYRPIDHYNGVQAVREDKMVFFARFYDKASLWARIPGAIGREPDKLTWWGEKAAGRFKGYEKRWIERGLDCTVNDAREIADHYRYYDAWEEMPGSGIVGMMWQKPAQD